MASGLIKLKNGWVRDTLQETGSVLRWYEKSAGNVIASIVQGDIPNEAEVRVSGDAIETVSTRLPLEKLGKYSDSTNIMKIENLISGRLMK